MLASIKNKTKGWVAYLIIGIIIIPFALFGIHDYIGSGGNSTVAEVDGEEISKLEYLNLLEKMVRNAQEQLGENYNQQIENNLKQQAINTLVDRQILTNIANELNFATAPSEIKNIILSDETFFKDGKFDLETYDNLLRLNGYTPKSYEAELLENKNNLQLRDNLVNAGFLTNYEKKLIKNLLDEKRDVSFSEISYASFNDKVKITDEEITNYYNDNKDKLIIPAKVRINFVKLKTTDLTKDINPNEDEINQLYDEEKTNWQTDEERNASHILVESKELAQKIKTEVNVNNFADLAKQHSTGPSAENGGSLGFFTKGVMVPEFEKVVFNMQVDEISDIVKTEFGYHIIKLNNISAAKTKPLAEVKSEIIDLYKQNKAKEMMFELGENLQNLVYEQGLEIAAEDMNLKIQTSNFLTTNSTEFSPKVLRQVFSDEVIKNNEAVVVEVDANEIIALNKNEFIAERVQTIDEAKTEIKEVLNLEKTKKLAENKANELITNKAKLQQDIGFVYRDNDNVQTAKVVNFAFGLPKNKAYGFYNDNDKLVVVNVSGSKIVPKQNPQNLDLLAKDYANELFNDIVRHIKQTTDKKVYPNLL